MAGRGCIVLIIHLLACFSTVATGAIQDKRLNSFSNEIQSGVDFFFNFLHICVTVDVFELNLEMEWMILLNKSVKTSKLLSQRKCSQK